MKFKDVLKEDVNYYMRDLFFKRTQYHIGLVQKYLRNIVELNDNRIDNGILKEEIVKHDESKYHEPEYPWYVYINYKYFLKKNGWEYNLGVEVEKEMENASYHHVKYNEHHPEFWDDNYNQNSNVIDAKNMPLSYIACMLADWFAMDEELNGNIYKWTDDFVNNKCKFTKEQLDFMKEIIEIYTSKIWTY